MTLGERLQVLRGGAGLSQEELAERLGVSRQAVSKWELDKTVPDVRYIVALSELFRVSTDYLLKEVPDAAGGECGGKPGHSAASVRDNESRPDAGQSACPPAVSPPVFRPWSAERIACRIPAVGCALEGALIGAYLLLCGVSFRPPGFWLLALALIAGPVLLAAGRALLWGHTVPAGILRRFRRAAASCCMLWGFAAALLLGYEEVIDDLLWSAVWGPGGISLLAGMTALLLACLWAAGWLLARILTRNLNKKPDAAS